MIGGYLLAALAGAAFVLIERTRARPLPSRLFRSRTFSETVCAGLLINVVFYGLIFTFSLFLQRHVGLSPFSAGLAFLPVTVLIMASDLIAGRAISRFGTRSVSTVGAIAMGAGCLAMFVVLSAHLPTLVAALSVTGFGIGLIVTAITSTLLGSVGKSWSGIASGTLTAFRQTGSVLGVALFGSLLAGTGAAAGLRTACAISAVLIVVVVALSFTTPTPASRPACLPFRRRRQVSAVVFAGRPGKGTLSRSES